MRITNQKEFWAGVMFVGFGAFFAGFGSQYNFGSAVRMGPGYFPTVLGVILMVLGSIVASTGVSAKATAVKLERFSWPTMLLILGPVVLFGLLLETIGLILSLLMLIGISSYASHEFSWKGALGNAAALITLSLVVFVYALKLQFPIWPAFFGA